MAPPLTFEYDWREDVLYIALRPSYAGQATEELGDEVIARLNPETDAIESLEILSFSSRLEDAPLELPVTAILRRGGSPA